MSEIAALSPRQRQVLDALIVHGTAQAAADTLGIALQTVKNHLTVIRGELGVATSLQAAVLYDRERRTEEDTPR